MTEPKPATGRFAGLTAIVTGASRGIGLVIAGRLVAEGGRVVLTGRGSEALEMFGTPDQKERWLQPLLDGQIRRPSR